MRSDQYEGRRAMAGSVRRGIAQFLKHEEKAQGGIRRALYRVIEEAVASAMVRYHRDLLEPHLLRITSRTAHIRERLEDS